MNIVFVSDQYWPSISGVPVSVDVFRKALTQLGHLVYLLVPDYPEAAEFDRKTKVNNLFRLRSYKIFFNDENRLVYSSEKKKVFDILRTLKPDIIHVHTEFSLAKIARLFAKKYDVPLIMTAHTNWEELIHHYVPFIPSGLARLYCRHRLHRHYNRADVVVVPTSLMELLLNLYFVSTPIRVIPTGIDKSEFLFDHSVSDMNTLGFNNFPQLNEKKILFFAGRIGKEKNIMFLMDALQLLLPEHPELMLVIAGDGPAREELQGYARERGIQEQVMFTGFIERKLLKEYYATADIFVFSSKVESQGMVILESMACGTPVVAIGKMGTREVMGGDSGGFMVDDELDVFVEKVQVLLDNPEIRQTKSEEALLHIEKWAIDIQAQRMLKLYESTILKKRNKKKC